MDTHGYRRCYQSHHCRGSRGRGDHWLCGAHCPACGAVYLVGANHARLIPASAILGALLLLLADDVARTILAPLELPAGVLTAALGGLFFLYLLKTRQGDLGARR